MQYHVVDFVEHGSESFIKKSAKNMSNKILALNFPKQHLSISNFVSFSFLLNYLYNYNIQYSTNSCLTFPWFCLYAALMASTVPYWKSNEKVERRSVKLSQLLKNYSIPTERNLSKLWRASLGGCNGGLLKCKGYLFPLIAFLFKGCDTTALLNLSMSFR